MNAADHTLLERYLKLGDHGAFTELVRRYLPLVHSAACRLSQNQAVAEEISQIVMSKLAGLRVMPPVGLSLAVWMHRTTRSVSIDLLRAETRRRGRERIFAMNCEPAHDDFPWENIAPVLDEIISQLADKERSVVLGRFFMGQSHAAIAESLNLSEDAVRMRVARALEKIGGLLRKRGIATTASALGFGLSAHAVTPVSSGLVSSISAAALGSAIPATFFLTAMTLKTAAVPVVILLMCATGVLVYQKSTTPPRQVSSGSAAASFEPPEPQAGSGSQERNAVVGAAERPELNMRQTSRAVSNILEKLGPGNKDFEIAIMLLKRHKDDLVSSTLIMEWLMEQNPIQTIREIAGIYDKVNPAMESAFRSFSERHSEQAWDLLSSTEDWKSRVMLTGMFPGMIKDASPERIASFLETLGTLWPE